MIFYCKFPGCKTHINMNVGHRRYCSSRECQKKRAAKRKFEQRLKERGVSMNQQQRQDLRKLLLAKSWSTYLKTGESLLEIVDRLVSKSRGKRVLRSDDIARVLERLMAMKSIYENEFGEGL